MNIQNMQKINELARQLVDKGVYESMEEATKQAEIMVNKGDSGISSVLGTEKQAQAKEGAGQQAEEDDLRLQLRKVSNQVKEQSRIISELREQLNSLLKDIERMKSSEKKQEQQPSVIEREKESGDDQTRLSKDATEKKSHARSGKYESDDVSIERFFYSGPPKE